MADHDQLIAGLAATAEPVKRVSPAWRRAAVLVPPMLALGWVAASVFHRAVAPWAAPDGGMGIANAALSLSLGVLILIRALALSVAGGEDRWGGWIRVALAAWLAVLVASVGTTADLSEAYAEGRTCFTFLVVAGLPMIAVVIVALRRTRSLRPTRSLLSAGASVAFFAFGLLAFCHPSATTAADTAGHLAAALLLGLLTAALGSRAISV